MHEESSLFFKKKVKSIVIYMLFLAITYQLTNQWFRLSLIDGNMPISESWIDLSIPYIPWTILIYLAYFIFLPYMMLSCKDKKTFDKVLTCNYLIVIIATFIYFFFPSAYYWDHSSYTDYFTLYMFNVMKMFDHIYNACPSEHVALSLGTPLVLLTQGVYKRGVIFLFFGILISISTLTVKQHYFVDCIAGLGLAMLCALIVYFFYHKFEILIGDEEVNK